MFYDKFVSLCKEKGVAPTRAALDIGLSKSAPIKWRTTGATPNGETLNKIAEYFSVSVSVLLGEETKKAHTQEGERIPHRDKRELLAGRGVSILLDADAKLTDEQLDDIVNFIQFQQEKNGR